MFYTIHLGDDNAVRGLIVLYPPVKI